MIVEVGLLCCSYYVSFSATGHFVMINFWCYLMKNCFVHIISFSIFHVVQSVKKIKSDSSIQGTGNIL